MYLCACVCLCISVYGELICLTLIFINSFLVIITFLIPKKKVYNQLSMIKLLKTVSFWLHNCLLLLN